MKLANIIRASEAMTNLTKKRFTNFKVARSLVALRKRVEEECNFLASEQQKAIKAFAELDENGRPIFLDDKHIQMKSPYDREKFEAVLSGLADMDIDDISPVEVAETDFADPRELPTPDEMFVLEGLVDFV